MNVLRAGSTGLILGHRVMAPSTLGTFLRAFTFGHVRQLDRVLDVTIQRAWEAGAGPGEGPLVIDLDSFIGEVYGYEKQGAGYGYTRTLGYHPIIATRADTGEVLHIRNRKGKANTQRGAERFVDELLARVRRAGHTGLIVLRADSGFENHKLMRALDRQGVEFSIGVKLTNTIKALIDEIPEQDWTWVPDYPETGEAQIAETKLGAWRLVVRRTRLVGAQAELWPDWRYHCFVTNRTVPILIADVDHRDHASVELTIRDLKDQALAHFPSGRFAANSAWTVIAALAHNLALDDTDRPAHRGRPDRPRPSAPSPGDPRTADPHKPPMDTPPPRPLAMEDRLHHRARRDPRAPGARLTTLRSQPAPAKLPTPTPVRSACRNAVPDAPTQTPKPLPGTQTSRQRPTPHSHNAITAKRMITHDNLGHDRRESVVPGLEGLR
jgi:hypothetical protein